MASSTDHEEGLPADLRGTRTKMLDAIKSMKRKLRAMEARGTRTKVLIPKLIEEELGVLANKRKLNLLLVGPAGAGKSTLANTLACQKICEVKAGVYTTAVTTNLSHTETTILTGQDGESECAFIVWDTPGFTGNSEADKRVAAEIEDQIPDPDMVIMCFDITAFGGRRLEFLHDNVIRELKKIRNGALFKRCAIAITKVNMLAVQCEHDAWKRKSDQGVATSPPVWHKQVEQGVNDWKKMWTTILTDCGLSKEQRDGIPVCVFGEMEFKDDERKTPCGVTPIGRWKRDWLKESWAEVVSLAPDALPLFLILSSQFHTNPDISESVRQHGPDPSRIKISKAALKIGMVAFALSAIAVGVGLAPFTAGISVGATIGGIALLIGCAGAGKAVHDHRKDKRESASSWKEDEDRQKEESMKAFYKPYEPAEAWQYLDEFEGKISQESGSSTS